MTQEHKTIPIWFWVVGALALAWNAFGLWNFIIFTNMSADAIAAMPEAEGALYSGAPLWATGAYAIAVFGGVLGALFLLLRNKLAAILFVASLAGIIVQFTHWFLMTDAIKVYGAETYPIPAVVTLIAIALVWFAHMAKGKGWIK